MAAIKNILRKSQGQVLAKVTGVAGETATIALATDLLATNETVAVGDVPNVNVNGFVWCGDIAGQINVTRGGQSIANFSAGNPGQIAFEQAFGTDNVNATSDIVVTFTGGTTPCQVWISLRKVGGYTQTFEPAQFGGYDNPAVAGS